MEEEQREGGLRRRAGSDLDEAVVACSEEFGVGGVTVEADNGA